MTTSLFELMFKALINVAVAFVLIGYVRRSIQRGYAFGLWWDFQRDAEPIRFWVWTAFVGVTAIASFWSGMDNVVMMRGQ
jgi:hypothetical protein